MIRERRTKLSTKISALTVVSSVCAILLLGISFICMFALLFLQKTEEDMRYFLSSTGQRFESVIQFVQDGAVSIRHNQLLDTFFQHNHYDKAGAEGQLVYCMDLFSARNSTPKGAPLAISVYLFNNKDDFIRTNYYPMTLSGAQQQDQAYQERQRSFKESEFPYQSYVDGEKISLCFRIYDERMKQMGVCIVALQAQSIYDLFADGKKYRDFAWMVETTDGQCLVRDGDITASKLSPFPTDGYYKNRHSLYHVLANGFGLRTTISIARNNIYLLLKPTLFVFVIALVAVLSFVCAAIFGISYRFTRPFEKMTAEISAFGQDDLSVRMQDFPVDEFHQISVAFNKMAERIDYLITQVYEKQFLATQSQVKFLQAQINPHFQYNILAMLSLNAKKAGNEELYTYLRAFSKLIQGKIFRDKEIKIPLSSEMELVNFYLLLQKGRFQEKLAYTISYGDDALHDCLIPKLLIEPLVENAVSHGLEPKSGPGRIDIRIFEEAGGLHIVVEDDGVGFDQADFVRTQDSQAAHTRTGLANARRLLNILYRQSFSMTVAGEKDKGTRVEIVLPLERASVTDPSSAEECGKTRGSVYNEIEPS